MGLFVFFFFFLTGFVTCGTWIDSYVRFFPRWCAIISDAISKAPEDTG